MKCKGSCILKKEKSRRAMFDKSGGQEERLVEPNQD